ncbi:MAG: hypothetical protein WBD83_06260, partial [Xanthobacteraceae bacterium]
EFRTPPSKRCRYLTLRIFNLAASGGSVTQKILEPRRGVLNHIFGEERDGVPQVLLSACRLLRHNVAIVTKNSWNSD